MKSNWAKKVKVPPEHDFYAAAYRYGVEEGQVRQAKREPQHFSASGAYEAYCAGFDKAREEFEKAKGEGA